MAPSKLQSSQNNRHHSTCFIQFSLLSDLHQWSWVRTFYLAYERSTLGTNGLWHESSMVQSYKQSRGRIVHIGYEWSRVRIVQGTNSADTNFSERQVTVSVRIRVRFSFSDRVGTGFPDVEWVEFYVGNPTCRQSQNEFWYQCDETLPRVRRLLRRSSLTFHAAYRTKHGSDT